MRKLILLVIMGCILFTGCESNINSIDEDKFNIVTSFYPIYIATSNIVDGIEGITIENMTNTQVGCLHDYQLTTRDMNKLEKADVFIVNGCGMETFLDKAISAYSELEIIDSSKGVLEHHDQNMHDVDLLLNGEGEENEEHVLKQSHESHGHNHEHGENAHIWVSIDLYIMQVENIANSLEKADPNNAEKYANNAKKYIEKLNLLKDEMHSGIDGLGNKNIVTFHEAFDFFAEDFDLNIVAVIEREPGTNPSAGEVAKIIDKVRETNAVAIFVEPQYETSTANVIARETGIPVYTLDPIVSGKLEKEEYENIMRKNLSVLKEALK